MRTTLTLQHTAAAVREPAAWFLPGGDPAGWLEEVARWPVPADAVVFYVLAGVGANAISAGVLAVPPAGTRVPSGGRAQPYGCAGPEIFLPVDAVIRPPSTAEELRAGAKFEVLIFHPALGLTGCERAEGRRAWDFLAAPEFAAGEIWSAACAGTATAAKLGPVRLAAGLSLDGLFGAESEEIGSEPLESLPPSPDEPAAGLPARMALGAAALLMKGMLGLTALLPRTARAPTWINAFENWVQKKLGNVTQDLDRRRNRELQRLLEMLANDPEEGLRHAIPLAALANRGRRAPSDRLARRNLDFSLRRIGGGGPADLWSVPADMQASLSQRYREMAMRESRLGRHRRAACILAELLGDIAGAAETLKQGRHFREAALLYQERMSNPLAAAECFAAGGMTAEALSIYEKMGKWIEAADLHARLGDREAERAAVRRAVAERRAAGDPVAAAQLLERRLGEGEEALALLDAHWPNGRQALACLEEKFALLERAKRPGEARALLPGLGRGAVPLPLVAPLTGFLAKLFEQAKDAGTRHAAADAVRLRVAAGLGGRQLDRADELTLLRALTRLAPEDRLLARDAMRFRETRPKPVVPQRTGAKAKAGFVMKTTLLKGACSSLPGIGGWARVAGNGLGYCAIAHTAKEGVFFSRVSWRSGTVQSASWPDPAPERGEVFFMAHQGELTVLGRPFADRLVQKTLPKADASFNDVCAVGTPAWLPADTVQVAASRAAVWAVRVVGPRIVLENFHQGERVDSRDVTDELMAAGATGGGTALVLGVQDGFSRVVLGFGHHLLGYDSSGQVRVSDLGERIVGLVGAGGVAQGWVVLLERGAAFVSHDQTVVERFDDSLEMPRGAVLGDGTAVLVGGEEGWVLRLEPKGATRLAHFQLPGGAGIGLLATPQPREFATVSEQGVVQGWKIAL